MRSSSITSPLKYRGQEVEEELLLIVVWDSWNARIPRNPRHVSSPCTFHGVTSISRGDPSRLGQWTVVDGAIIRMKELFSRNHHPVGAAGEEEQNSHLSLLEIRDCRDL